MKRAVLTIAGSDPSCGAGMPADLITFTALGCQPLGALTAIVAQNSQRVSILSALDPQLVQEQIVLACEECEPSAIKVGALCSEANIIAVTDALTDKRCPIIVDPVLVASVGAQLLPESAIDALRTKLLPMATLITPNIREASALLRRAPITTRAEMERVAYALCEQGIQAALITGGDLPYDFFASDYLAQGSQGSWFNAVRLPFRNGHGTGCVLSAAIAAYLAQGTALSQAVAKAKNFLARERRKKDDGEDNTTAQLGCQSLPHAHLHRTDARLL